MELNAVTPDAVLDVIACAYSIDIKEHGSEFDIITAEMLIITLAGDPSLVVLGVCMQNEVDNMVTSMPRTMFISRLKSLSAARSQWILPSLSLLVAVTIPLWL